VSEYKYKGWVTTVIITIIAVNIAAIFTAVVISGRTFAMDYLVGHLRCNSWRQIQS
jgi:hypothetical protein